jgi:amidophosphoribosyltransferase
MVRDDRFHDNCGIFGIYGHGEAANLTYLGLYALQHRGQESAGIVTSDRQQLYSHKGMGLVNDVFGEDTLLPLKGDIAIGHVRYSTTGGCHIRNAQPFAVDFSMGSIAVAHNGNLVNALDLRSLLESRGSIFQSSMDTEVVAHLIATSRAPGLVDRIRETLAVIKGSYSMLFMTEKSIIAVRDPMGFRPMCLGRVKDAYVVASETPALDLIEGEYIRDVDPGEMVIIDENGIRSLRFQEAQPAKACIFEYIYFARPDSFIFGREVYNVRKAFGHQLAREHKVSADMVMAIPDSGNVAALGYAEESGIPFEMGLIRSHYVGRTFIEPQQQIRHFGVKLKLHPVHKLLDGKRVVVVDDSIVRGTTSRKIVKMIRAAGAKEVNVIISSPPTVCPCYYGIDTPTRQELIASSHSVEEIRKYLTADYVGYLSVEGMHKAIKSGGEGFCDACFTGNYPIDFESQLNHRQMHLF